MCWCRWGEAGAWQPSDRCHGDGIAERVQLALDHATAATGMQLPIDLNADHGEGPTAGKAGGSDAARGADADAGHAG